MSCTWRRPIAGSLFRAVPLDQLFLNPFKSEIRSTFNGMVENERQARNKREAGDRGTPQLEPGVLDALEQRLGASDSGVNRERRESPDKRKTDIRNTFLSRRMRGKTSGDSIPEQRGRKHAH